MSLASKGSERLSAARSLLLKRPLLIATVVLLIVLCAQALLKHQSEWLDVYVRAGMQLWRGENFYAEGSPYFYPPFAALLASPFGALPGWLARLVLFAINAVALIVAFAGAWRIAGGMPLRGLPLTEKGEWLAFGAGVACSLAYTLNALAHQQTDVLIGALVIAGAFYLRTERQALAGSLIGLAAAFKATPLLFGPYLLMRRQWLAAVCVGIVALAVNLLPDLVNRSPVGTTWVEQWVTRYVLPTQGLNAELGQWGTELIYNQALGGTMQRLINTRLALDGRQPQSVPRPLLRPATIKPIVNTIFVVLLAVSIVAALRARRRAIPDRGGLPGQDAFEFSIIITLMLLMSPMSGRAHFGILVLPAFCLARAALVTRDRVLWGVVGSAAVITVFSNKDLVGSFAHGVMLWVGSTTLVALLLWFGCVYALHRGLVGGDSRQAQPMPASSQA